MIGTRYRTTIRAVGARLMCLVILIVMTASGTVSALDPAQKQLHEVGIDRFNIKANTSCGASNNGDASLIGGDNAQKAWNFYIGKGLAPHLIGAILGNLERESNIMPERIQGSPAKFTKNPQDAGSLGWGIMQWTPATKITGLMDRAGITTPVYELSSQLEMEWWHLNNISPTGLKNVMADFRQQTTVEDATKFYMDKMEGPAAETAALDLRIKFAKAAIARYGDGTATPAPGADPAAAATGCTSSTPTGPVGSCTQKGDMTGNEAIVACAKLFDPYGYLWGGGHSDPEAFMKDFNANGGFTQPFKQVVDCSGLENVAIWLAFGVKIGGYSTATISSVSVFRKIPVSEAKPGDIMWRSGHTEIATSNAGKTTFGAHTANRAPAGQIGDSSGQGWTAAYVYTGKGSTRQ